MKRRHFLLLLFICGQLTASVSAVAQWQKEVIPGSQGNLHSLFFISDQIGFIVACDPTQSSWSSNYLIKTVDGGKSWTFGKGSELCAPSVFFVNKDIGYYATRGSSIGNQGVLRTADGGTTWSMADTTVGAGSSFEPTALYFLNDLVGFAGTEGAINRTTNGGKSWLSSYSSTGFISSIKFTSEQTGYAVGYDSPIILKTTDGGVTWDSVTNQYALLSIAFPSPSVGYAVGVNGTIVYTNDAGTTWNIPTSTDGNQQTLRSVFCMDDNTCFAVGDNGTILKTTDGGHSWAKQISGTTQRLTSVACPDNNTCFAVGDSVTLLKIANAGSTGVFSPSEQSTGVRIYSDPNTSTVIIQPAAPTYNAVLSLFNLFGQQIMQMDNLTDNNITIDSRNLSAGLYFFTIQQDNKIVTGKFILE